MRWILEGIQRTYTIDVQGHSFPFKIGPSGVCAACRALSMSAILGWTNVESSKDVLGFQNFGYNF